MFAQLPFPLGQSLVYQSGAVLNLSRHLISLLILGLDLDDVESLFLASQSNAVGVIFGILAQLRSVYSLPDCDDQVAMPEGVDHWLRCDGMIHESYVGICRQADQLLLMFLMLVHSMADMCNSRSSSWPSSMKDRSISR